MVERRLLLGTAITIASAVLFCTKSVLLKLAYAAGSDAGQMIWLRMSLALPGFIMLVWYHERRARTPLSARALAGMACWGLVSYGLCPYLDFTGLEYIPVSTERMVLYAYPTLVVVFSLCRGVLRPTWTLWVGLCATYLGVAFTFGEHSAGHSVHASLGILLVGLCAVAYAAFLVGSSTGMRTRGDQRFMSWAMCCACVGVMAHALLSRGLAITSASPTVWAYGVALAVPGTIVPAMLTGAGLRLIGPSRFAVVSTVGPLGTVLMAMLVLDEHPSAHGWLGIVLTLGGGLITGLGKAPPTTAAALAPSRAAALPTSAPAAGARESAVRCWTLAVPRRFQPTGSSRRSKPFRR